MSWTHGLVQVPHSMMCNLAKLGQVCCACSCTCRRGSAMRGSRSFDYVQTTASNTPGLSVLPRTSPHPHRPTARRTPLCTFQTGAPGCPQACPPVKQGGEWAGGMRESTRGGRMAGTWQVHGWTRGARHMQGPCCSFQQLLLSLVGPCAHTQPVPCASSARSCMYTYYIIKSCSARAWPHLLLVLVAAVVRRLGSPGAGDVGGRHKAAATAAAHDLGHAVCLAVHYLYGLSAPPVAQPGGGCQDAARKQRKQRVAACYCCGPPAGL